MVDAKERQRLALALYILDAVRCKSFRSETLATASNEHVIVPALPDDTMASLFDQVRLSGGPVHVATLHDNALAVFAMVPHKPARHAIPQTEPDDEFPVSPDMSVGILVDYLILRDRPVVFRAASPQVSLELVENPAAGTALKTSPRTSLAGCRTTHR
jgi:hypothetical protein